MSNMEELSKQTQKLAVWGIVNGRVEAVSLTELICDLNDDGTATIERSYFDGVFSFLIKFSNTDVVVHLTRDDQIPTTDIAKDLRPDFYEAL